MKVIINSKDKNLSKEREKQLLKKLDEIPHIIKRFGPEDKTANVRIQKGSRWGYKMSFSMWLPKKRHIFAKVKGKNFKEASDELKELVVRQITDYKEILSENRIKKKKILNKLR